MKTTLLFPLAFVLLFAPPPANADELEEIGHYPCHCWSVECSGNFAYVGTAGPPKLLVLDVSDPRQPQKLAERNINENPYRIRTDDSYAYIAAGSEGLITIDIRPPYNLSYSYYCPSGGKGFARDLVLSGGCTYLADFIALYVIPKIGSPKSIACNGDIVSVAVSGNRAYIGDGYDLRAINITDPTHPQEAGTWHLQARCGRLAVQGNYAYVSAGNQLMVVDITSTAEPINVIKYAMPNEASDVAISDSYVYVGDTSGKILVSDISDTPKLTLHQAADIKNLPRSIDVCGDYIYVAGATSAPLLVI
jgi:hypothetical protein